MAVKIRQGLRVQRQHQHTAEGLVGIVQTAGQLDRPLARGTAQNRLADEQAVVGLLVHLEMLAVGQVQRDETGDSAFRQHAVGVDTGQLERDVAQDGRAHHHLVQVEALGVFLVRRFHVHQRLVETGHGPLDVFLEGAGQIGVVRFGLRQHPFALAAEIPGQTQPEQRQDKNTEGGNRASGIHPDRQRTWHGDPLAC